MTFVRGIEITSVHRGKDVHVLAYFLSESAPGLQEMLANVRSALRRPPAEVVTLVVSRADAKRLLVLDGVQSRAAAHWAASDGVVSANSRISAARVPVWPIVLAIGR